MLALFAARWPERSHLLKQRYGFTTAAAMMLRVRVCRVCGQVSYCERPL